MFDHVTMYVSDFDKNVRFYEETLAPLGCNIQYKDPKERVVGFGTPNQPSFWMVGGTKRTQTHLAFQAQNRKQVEAFYNAAIAAGGKDNGKPGIRSHYHENYYAAFVIDPEGNNIEAVCHRPE